jgi:hemerythrin
MILMWTHNLSVGVKRFDADHKRLIKIVNELHLGTQNSDSGGKMDPKEIEKALHRLEKFAKYHCAREVRAMAKTGFPKLKEHKEEHEKLFAMIIDMQQRFKGSASVKDAEEIMLALHDWMTDHINTVDKEFTHHLHLAGIF